MKRHVMLISTSKSRLIDTKAVMAALKGKIIGALKLDMDEQAANLANLFFEDLTSATLRALDSSGG